MTKCVVIGRGSGALAAIAMLALRVSGAEVEPPWQFVDVTSVQASVRLAGRVNAAVADPKDPNVMYIATDGGASHRCKWRES